MSVHNHTPAILEHGLQDDCPRCAEHASYLFSLDDENLRTLISRTLAWMRDEEYPRSQAEGLAMRNIEGHIRFTREMERLFPAVTA